MKVMQNNLAFREPKKCQQLAAYNFKQQENKIINKTYEHPILSLRTNMDENLSLLLCCTTFSDTLKIHANRTCN